MKFLALLLVAAICEARPGDHIAQPALIELGAGSFIVGGTTAGVGEYPWQLSQQRMGAAWSHSCGASLLSASRALSAAHCVDGASVAIIRVIAGLHDRTAIQNGVIANLNSYRNHAGYNNGVHTFNNDISVFHLASNIPAGGNIAFASLPTNNDNQHVGETVWISGWGRTSSAQTLPNLLQHAPIQVISQAECNQRMAPVSGANVGPPQICVFNPSTGSCNGDSGGPMNWASGSSRFVIGVTSWGIQSGGACLQSYPSVYSRVSFFLQWIIDNS